MGFQDASNIGTSLLGAYSEYNKGKAEAGMIGHDRKVNKLNTDLELRSAGKKRKSAVGAEISRVAGSGVQLDLEDIARMESEYLLDEAIIKEEGRVGQAIGRMNQKAVKNTARAKMEGELYDAFKGGKKEVAKTKTWEKVSTSTFGKSKFGSWLQR